MEQWDFAGRDEKESIFELVVHQQFVYYLLVHLYMFFEFMKIVLDMQAFLYVFQLNFQQLLLRDSSLKEESLFDSENFFVSLFEVI